MVVMASKKWPIVYLGLGWCRDIYALHVLEVSQGVSFSGSWPVGPGTLQEAP